MVTMVYIKFVLSYCTNSIATILHHTFGIHIYQYIYIYAGNLNNDSLT
jgi:hypothetical protein